MRHLFVTGLALLTACAHGPALFQRAPKQSTTIDTLYQKAVTHLDETNKQSSLDSALKYLDLYLASPSAQPRRSEAGAMRRLARDAQQLERVQAALQQSRASTESRARQDPDQKRDEEAVKEIQRLKDELAKANAELERIKKRLATPNP